MKVTLIKLCVVALLVALSLAGCKEKIDTSARYVFKERTIASYLESHEQFSEYLRLLKEQKVSEISETSVYQLMTAYGQYTCFAPNNKALSDYLDTLVRKHIIPEPSWDAFPSKKVLDSIRSVIVLNSLIDGREASKIYSTGDFPLKNEEFDLSTMADRKISVSYDDNDIDAIYIDGTCALSKTNRDIECINGYLHELSYVINPSNETLGSTMHRYAYDFESGLSVMAKLIEACDLIDTLEKIKDDVWDYRRRIGKIPEAFDDARAHFHDAVTPEHRKYGFTLFAETDEFWAQTLGMDFKQITPEDVKDWVVAQGFYPQAVDNGNYRDENNVLNQFVTYHLLPLRLSTDKLVLHYNEKGYNYRTSKSPAIPVWSHYTTMGKRRLLRLWESAESRGIYLNRFPVLDNERHGTYHELTCSEEDEGVYINTGGDAQIIRLVNSVIYPIDKVLVYSDHVRSELAKQRLRYDIFDFTREMINNDMRLMGFFKRFYFPPDETYQYFDDLWINSRETFFFVLNGWAQDWPNYQADEVCTEGLYDCTWRVPPVPKSGTYEIRMGVSTESPWRGICQIYFGTDRDNLVPQGIPVDMALGGEKRNLDGVIYKSNVGWIQDTDDDDYNAEVDKKMRNNGFMKGPEYIVENPGSSTTNRMQEKSTRRIIVRQYMDADKTYYLRFKTVQDSYSKQLFLDYMEWCPKEVYDNPETPEDIW